MPFWLMLDHETNRVDAFDNWLNDVNLGTQAYDEHLTGCCDAPYNAFQRQQSFTYNPYEMLENQDGSSSHEPHHISHNNDPLSDNASPDLISNSENQNDNQVEAEDVSIEQSHNTTSSFRKYKRGFLNLPWVKSLTLGQSEKLYELLTQSWPRDLEPGEARRWDHLISRWLHRNPYCVQGLKRGDKDIMMAMQLNFRADKMIERIKKWGDCQVHRKHRRAVRDTVQTGWLAYRFDTKDVDHVVSRLSQHWGFTDEKATLFRITSYANTYGPIQTLQPLLSQDKDTFYYAANLIAIAPSHRKKTIRHADAGENDILHCNNGNQCEARTETESVKPSRRRMDAKKYRSGHSWLKSFLPEQVDEIHNLIASHWIENLYKEKKTQYTVAVNNYLEKNPESLEKVKNGNDVEAWKVARAVVKKKEHMIDYDEYVSSQEHINRTISQRGK